MIESKDGLKDIPISAYLLVNWSARTVEVANAHEGDSHILALKNINGYSVVHVGIGSEQVKRWVDRQPKKELTSNGTTS